jgi:propanol-preferring alcohol dehydrogenase
MQAIHFLGNGKLSICEIPAPLPKGDRVVVKITAAGICGTDRHPFLEHGQKTIPGHENAGIVVAVDKPSWVKPGDRVAVNCHVTCHACEYCIKGDLFSCKTLEAIGYEWDGGFAEYLLVPEANLHALPEDISCDQGALMVDVFGTAYSGVKKAGLLPGDQVGVWGAGPVGLAAALSAQALGARVAIMDLSEYRLEMARKVSPELVLDVNMNDTHEQLREWTQGRGLDVALECVGSEKAALQGLSLLKPLGKLGLIGVGHSLTLDYWDLIQRQIRLYALRNFNTNEFTEMVALIQRGLRVDSLITHRFPLREAEKAFALFIEGACGKIVLSEN